LSEKIDAQGLFFICESYKIFKMITQNPWIGFAHPDHQADELEPLVRTLRYALIDLQKFWVDVESIPVFKSGLSSSSLEEMEKIFNWVIQSPEWSEEIQSTRLVCKLSHPESRKRIQEFARSVLCVRSILEELKAKASKIGRDLKSLDEVWKKIGEAKPALERRKSEGAFDFKRAELESSLAQAKKEWFETSEVLKFFTRVSQETGAPLATQSFEGLKVLKALEAVSKMPEAVRPWRTAHVLEASQKIRLQAWRDRARPIVELRKRLETFFNLESDVTIEELTRLSEALRADGVFAQFKAPYKEALEKYRTLLRGGVALKVDSKNNGFQKAEKLKEWINLIEQSRAYAAQSEARQAFSPLFQGIDTDFASALEANAWAKSIRDEFLSESADIPIDGVSYTFDASLISFVTQVAEEKIPSAAQLIQSPETATVLAHLQSPRFQTGGSFSGMEQESKKRCWDYKKLLDVSHEIGLSSEIAMKELNEIALRVEEAYFLIQRMDADKELQSFLKEIYAGIDTDLSVIEPCAAYVKSVKSFQFPTEIESSLLSAYGPQRLSDARSLVARCLTRVSTLHEHYRKLEAATRDEIRSIAHGKELEAASIVELMERIQSALKNAQHLADVVAELRAKRDSSLIGLKVDRDSADASHDPCLIPNHHESGGH
jgi:hypothetical protein